MNPIRTLLASLILGAFVLPTHAAVVHAPHVEAELISETTSLQAGENTLALRLKPDAGWHTYWRNPGDTGQATKIEWTLPQGVTAGDIEWPYPQSFRLGDLTNFGYGEETLHLVTITVAQGLVGPIEITAHARWLVCADVCIPGRADLSLDLPLAARSQPDERWQRAFETARQHLPARPDLPGLFTIRDHALSLSVGGLDLRDAKVTFIPLTRDLLKLNAEPLQFAGADGWRMTQALAEGELPKLTRLEGVLLADRDGHVQSYAIAAQVGNVTPLLESDSRSLPLILCLAVLGGLILNLMPCVFPVLSLKAMALLQHRDASTNHQRRQALSYTAGVMLSCGAVAGLLLVLRAGGQAIGWGFQLQSPIFVAALAYLMFALGLSLSGVVDFGGRFMGLGQSLTVGNSNISAFFTGVLATVVASPCTAPFMGTALGYAVTQSPITALSVFFALGFGLALPFLLLGFFPRLAAFLPRPGAWMETFKQSMAFPLYLTVVWLIWVVMQQSGSDAAAISLAGLVLVAFALWLWHSTRRIALLLKALALIGAALLLAHPALRSNASTHPAAASERTEAYSDQRLAQLRAEKRTVFVNLTADWCLTCKVNEHTSLNINAVQQAFAENHVALLVGDWTRSDAAITRVLTRFGRNGVPLYLVYLHGGEPQILPQILTPQLVLDALKQ